ncbi:MAG: FHA domain-containing protein [Myxococcales bacterium]|nr:FHA domain-containing protein [Myxococcales bacterium]
MLRRASFLIDAEGRRTPIGERLIIGRAREVGIVIQTGAVSRHHVALVRLPAGDVEAEDLGTTNGTLLNDEPLRHRVLAPGDVLEVAGRRYTFELGPPVDVPTDRAATMVAKAGGDEAALQVAVDVLLEQGDPAGAQLALGQRVALASVIQRAVDQGSLELDWRRGFVRNARFRAESFHTVRELLFALLSSEAGRFLESLTLPDFDRRLGLEGAVLPALLELRFGPFFTADEAGRCRTALADVRFPGAPFIVRPVVQQFSRAWLEFDAGQRRDLEQGRQASFPTCVVRWEPGGWLVSRDSQAPTLTVNGRSRFSAGLVPGDVVSSGATRFTFRAS